jgi:hypothetical protein
MRRAGTDPYFFCKEPERRLLEPSWATKIFGTGIDG